MTSIFIDGEALILEFVVCRVSFYHNYFSLNLTWSGSKCFGPMHESNKTDRLTVF